ncbi:DNA alkylation repair protein [Bacillus horti]|uniref:Rubredoxin n=1 Tax=Caldalkalibacillus horti TaxID=77523 RepID=A0ABT9W2L5_9BACI|nr:DNA alkylation repair protein [Bacillus horti]MDQ0167488.1 rubredoxin [Bacillus horti]
MTLYCCPSCQSKSRFNVINQVVTPIKVSWPTGETEVLEQLEPYHVQYQGPENRIQCGSCGLIEDELRFEKMAQRMKPQ